MITESDLDRVVRTAIAEDVGTGDATTNDLVDDETLCCAELLLKEPGVVCGLDAAEAVFRALDDGVVLDRRTVEGEIVSAAPVRLADLEGHARALLTGERVALNLLGRLSGIATLTRAFACAVEGTGATILDTRKTTPGLRVLEKQAVRCGGGVNHRLGLDDGILVKDNHLRVVGGIQPAIDRLRDAGAGLPIEVEVETLEGLREALAAGADRILLDNMPPERLAEAVQLTGGRVPLEASGGVTLESVRRIAETGVDFISIGALTHSARSLDVSMEIVT